MASTYTMVAYGSQGSAVRQLQNELNKRGYSLDQDGIFGKKTRAAVQDHQKKNGLTMVDGIAGDETWGACCPRLRRRSRRRRPQQQRRRHPGRRSRRARRGVCRSWRGYTPSDEVTAAQAYRDSVAALEPEAYRSRFEERLQALMRPDRGAGGLRLRSGGGRVVPAVRQTVCRPRRPMEDTLGKAAALTGGYASSYAQSAGSRRTTLFAGAGSVVPELRQAALAEYQQEGKALQNQYSMLDAQEKARL